MTPLSILALATSVLSAVLAGLWLRSRAQTRELGDRLSAAARQLERLQVSFGRFAPEAVIEEIIASGVPTQGEKKEVTILFADLVGFTALSEKVEPAQLVSILNGYFETMAAAIRGHRGYLASLAGDGILALFGALEANPWQADDAVHAALAMRRELLSYNDTLVAQGLEPLAIGIGLHHGSGVAGLVGSQDLMAFTVVGRTINLASRVQDLTRDLNAEIIITESLRKKIDPRFRCHPLPATRVKGISEPLTIYALSGWEGESEITG
ncbi:MAG: adenylate/guanylate cyclase domain-containing protein [bacterium]|nr:adenylate/guanylate cyclase domain-containing protein [bacterium]